MANKNKLTYSYTSLADVKKGGPGCHNVFGVIKFIKVPIKTRGTDFSQVLSIIDESLEDGEKLVVTLFYDMTKKFPSAAVGDIIRFHRLKVELVQDDLKGRPGPGFSWLFVHDDVDNPSASSQIFSFLEQHKKRVKELQKWAMDSGLVRRHSPAVTLSSMVEGQYCDLVCQVIGSTVEKEGVCFVTRVWDGTQCRHPTVHSAREMENMDFSLEEKSANLAVDVWIYDDHFHYFKMIKPGQFVKFCNLHAALHKGTDSLTKGILDLPTLELTLHHGTAYGRGLVILEEISPQFAAIKQLLENSVSGNSLSNSQASHSHIMTTANRLSACSVDCQDGCNQAAHMDAHEAKAGCSHWLQDNNYPVQTTTALYNKSNASMANKKVFPIDAVDGSDMYVGKEQASKKMKKNQQLTLQSPLETCMLQTGTVVSGHQHIGHTTISQLLLHAVPSKFRVLAHLVTFHPNTLQPLEFLQIFCPKCFQLKQAGMLESKFTNWNPEELDSSEHRAFCPDCSTGSKRVLLELTYMLQLVLQDANGDCLVANLWLHHAVTFFRGVKPERMLKDEGLFHDIIQAMCQLCLLQPSKMRAFPPPMLDCCLFSYVTPSGTNFQIFDTVLV